MANYQHARRSIKEEKLRLESASERLEESLSCQKIVQEVASRVQESAHAQIAQVVTKCLSAVFDDPYAFKVIFEQKRGKTEARLTYVRDGQEFHPTSEAGGGVVDLTSFALRLSKVVLQRPVLRRFLVLDEPFKHLSRDYAPRVRRLIERLAEEMGFQFVLVTHSTSLAAGKVVEIGA